MTFKSGSGKAVGNVVWHSDTAEPGVEGVALRGRGCSFGVIVFSIVCSEGNYERLCLVMVWVFGMDIVSVFCGYLLI